MTSLATPPGRRRGDRLQLRVHPAPDPARGHRRAARDRRPADAVARRRRSDAKPAFVGAADPGAAAARLRDGPDRRALRDRSRPRSSTLLFGDGSFGAADLDLIAATLCRLPRRADRARADRRAGPRVLRAPGHAHAGPRRGRRGRRQRDARGPARRAARAAGHRAGDRDRGLARGHRPDPRPGPPGAGLRRRSALVGVGLASAVGDGRRGRGRVGRARDARADHRSRPGQAGPRRWRSPSRASPSASSTRASRSPCGSPNCRLSSGSWSTCSAARDRRDGARRADRVRGPCATAGVGRLRRGERTRARTSSSRRGPPSRRSTAGRRIGSSPTMRQAGRSAPRSSSGGRDRCRGASPTRRAGPVAASWTAAAIDAFTERVRAGIGRPPGAVSHLRIDPEIEVDGPLDADGTPAPRPARRGLATGTADPADRDAGHRPARRRGRAVGRPAQEVAPVRQQGADRRRGRRRRRRGSARRVLPDLPRDRGPGRLPDPDRARVPRRVGRVSARPAAPGCCSPRPPTASRVATLFLVRCGPRVVEPYGGMTAAGGGVPGQLPAQVGGDPHARASGRDELRPVGPRDRRDRPLQDRVRRPRGPVHRRLGPRPRPARAPGLRGRRQRARVRWARRRTGVGASGAARPTFGATE